MTGGNEGGRPLTQAQPTNPDQPQVPGSQSRDDWNRDQLRQNLERQAEMVRRRTNTPDGSPPPDEDGSAGTTTKSAGSEGTTRY